MASGESDAWRPSKPGGGGEALRRPSTLRLRLRLAALRRWRPRLRLRLLPELLLLLRLLELLELLLLLDLEWRLKGGEVVKKANRKAAETLNIG